MSLSVNDVEISEATVAAEVQNHPAPDFETAETSARRALVVRELLRQEIERRGIEATPEILDDGKRETGEDAAIRVLLEEEISTPTPDEESCRRYYENNKKRFRTPDIYEAAHILFPADPQDEAAAGEARRMAESVIRTLTDDPDAFERLAAEHSACSSAKDGGRLGQVTRGQTLPEFESFLEALEVGQLSPVPVPTRVGFHVLRLDRHEPGRLLPFDKVKDVIAEYLSDHAWQTGVAQYLRILAGRAKIEGVDLEGTDSPLVQ